MKKQNNGKVFYKRPAIPGRGLPNFNNENNNNCDQHCCELINMFLADPRISLSYSLMYREYYIPLFYRNRITALQGLFFCPWCGKELPKSVREEWFEILEKEYHLDDPYREEQEILIPEEFKSDAWWKMRGL